MLVHFIFLYYFCSPKVVPWLYRWQQNGCERKVRAVWVLHLRKYKLLVTVGERQKKITASIDFTLCGGLGVRVRR